MIREVAFAQVADLNSAEDDFVRLGMVLAVSATSEELLRAGLAFTNRALGYAGGPQQFLRVAAMSKVDLRWTIGLPGSNCCGLASSSPTCALGHAAAPRVDDEGSGADSQLQLSLAGMPDAVAADVCAAANRCFESLIRVVTALERVTFGS